MPKETTEGHEIPGEEILKNLAIFLEVHKASQENVESLLTEADQEEVKFIRGMQVGINFVLAWILYGKDRAMQIAKIQTGERKVGTEE